MAAIVGRSPLWWDRDLDNQGIPIRADVRRAAHELWPQALRRVERALSDSAEAPGLLEDAVAHVSRHLDRRRVPLFEASVPSLLSLHFSQELGRLAKWLSRVQFVGDSTMLEEVAVDPDWMGRLHRYLEFEKIFRLLNERSRTVVVMRLQQHDWEIIGHKMGVMPATLRQAFWRDIRDVLSRLGYSGNGAGEEG